MTSSFVQQALERVRLQAKNSPSPADSPIAPSSEIDRLAGEIAERFFAHGREDRLAVKVLLLDFAAEIKRSAIEP